MKDEIDRLKKELDTLKIELKYQAQLYADRKDEYETELAENQALCDGCKCVATLKEVIRRLKAELAEVSEMLKKYGRHIPPCQGAAFPNCTCGFNEAKEKR